MKETFVDPQVRGRAAAMVAAAALASAAPVAAGPGPGYFATDNVEWIT